MTKTRFCTKNYIRKIGPLFAEISSYFFSILITPVFPQIDPAGTIYYLRSRVRVLIKGGLYLRAGSIPKLGKGL